VRPSQSINQSIYLSIYKQLTGSSNFNRSVFGFITLTALHRQFARRYWLLTAATTRQNIRPNYSRSVMEGTAVNNRTIFVIYNNVSTTCFGHLTAVKNTTIFVIYNNVSTTCFGHLTAVNNTTIFVICNNVSTTCFGHFLTGHHQVGYNVRGTICLL
jgi:hypothetical protein